MPKRIIKTPNPKTAQSKIIPAFFLIGK
jgi:hypothetical protein